MKKLFLLFAFVFSAILPVSSYAGIEVNLYLNSGCSVQESFISNEYIEDIEISESMDSNETTGILNTFLEFYFKVLCISDSNSKIKFEVTDLLPLCGTYSFTYMSLVNVEQIESVPSVNQDLLNICNDSNSSYYDITKLPYGFVEIKATFNGH